MTKPEGFAETLTHDRTIACLSSQKWLGQHGYYVLKMSVNGASVTFGHALWKIPGLCGDIKP